MGLEVPRRREGLATDSVCEREHILTFERSLARVDPRMSHEARLLCKGLPADRARERELAFVHPDVVV